jgi:hypothetical protein
MNSISLIKSLIEENEQDFKETLSVIMEDKIRQKKRIIAFETLREVFEAEKSLNNMKPNYEVIDVLQECVKQNSNISLILEDGNEVTLKPLDSKNVLSVFDNLNEKNQAQLVNRLIETKANFMNTTEFCFNFKERYTK